MPPKKGFGEKLKGFGRAIGREAKKIPGTIYREGIKPELERIRDKFTEEGPAPTRPISGEPQAGTTTAPFKEGERGFRLGRRTAHKEPKILPKETMSRPAPKVKTIKEQLKGAYYPLAGGRTSSYNVPVRMVPRPGETMKTPAFVARQKKAQDARDQRKSVTPPRTGEKPTLERPTPKPEPKKAPPPGTGRPRLERGTPEEKRKRRERGSLRGYQPPVFKTEATATAPRTEPAIAKTPTPKKETRIDRTAAARKQRAGLKESRKGKAGKRKFSATKTYAELGKAASASQKPIERIDTSAQDLARILTEQEVGREAERAEAALKGGRKPQREKARYRLRTRGYKRSEGRSR